MNVSRGSPRQENFAPNVFIRIDARGLVTLTIPQVEMGQGIYTALAMVLAEELDADWKAVRVEHAPADQEAYGNPLLGIQMTGNSTSVRAFWEPLRIAGASARACLIEAAARRWNIAASQCSARNSIVFHAGSNRALTYAALITDAGSVSPPDNVALKDPRKFRLIGRSLRRLDTAEKVDGRAKYGIDVMLPGMSFATVLQSPVLGATVSNVREEHARAVAGVRQVIVLNDAVAVIGDHMGAAQKGLEALEVSWTKDALYAQASSDSIWSRLREASKRAGAIAAEVGQVDATFGEAGAEANIITAEYELPLLAHACMEPLNCTVHITQNSAQAWLGTQVMGGVRAAIAKAADVPEHNVTVHNHLLGGGFGRRLETDMASLAARVAKHVAGPVKVVWSREEDIRQDIFRPPYHNTLSARLKGGRIIGWKHKVSGSAILARFLPNGFANGVDLDGVESAHDVPYDFPNARVEFNREEPPGVRTGLWRGVGSNNAVFAIESFLDELAHRVNSDPIDFRRAHLGSAPRLRAVLDLVREKSGWGAALAKRCGRGVAAQASFGSALAAVVECEVDEQGQIELQRATVAVDSGLAINPDTIIAQLQGGLIFGLTAALYGEITLKGGRVQQSNFHDYPLMRINEAPPIEVHLIKSGEPPGGIGEAGTSIAAPALRNAIYAATGIALRRMPVDRRALAVSAAGL